MRDERSNKTQQDFHQRGGSYMAQSLQNPIPGMSNNVSVINNSLNITIFNGSKKEKQRFKPYESVPK
jgi:hypothetical protein